MNDAPTFGEVAADPSPVNIQGMAADHREDLENLVIAGYTATDPEGADVTLSLMGDDAALFELADDIDTMAGANQELSFKEEPDFENPADRNSDNIYQVTVRASDSVLNTDIDLSIKVTDADEAGEVEVPQDALIGVELTATLTDSDTGAPDPAQFIDQVWQWHRLDAATTEVTADNAITGADSPSYTPVVADRDMFLRAMVTYTDRTRDENNDDTGDNAAGFVGFTNTVTSNATTAVRNNPSNQRPVFAEGSSTVRLVEENTEALTDPDDDGIEEDNPADNVGGGPVVATDADDDTANYTLTGSDMFRVRDNGQIEVSDEADLDYETSRSHTVTLTADDGTGEANGTASITVNIHVTDLDERPTITSRSDSAAIGEQTIEYVENSTGPVIRLMARDPEGVTPIVWSLSEVADVAGDQDLGIFPAEGDDVVDADLADREFFEISQDGVLTFASAPNFEATADEGAEGADNEYEVVVQASDGGVVSHANWFKVTVNVTDEPEGGAIAEWTIDPDGAATEENVLDKTSCSSTPLPFLPSLTRPMATARPINIQWQWFRSSSKSGTGTAIDEDDGDGDPTGSKTNTYTVQDTPENPNDVGKYLRVQATYNVVGSGSTETASFVSINPVQKTRDSGQHGSRIPRGQCCQEDNGRHRGQRRGPGQGH